VAAARRARTDAQDQSRTPAMLVTFRKSARRELGPAGTPALAAKTEQLRERWVADRMVEAGRARAVSLGWPDAYAYTKALGEQALMENRGAVPVSIVRPSIIESALAEPRPGWIRGFRMAEPVIISYARGLLKEFPGVPEGTIDVIPVDLVVSAVVVVAALGPDEAPAITQVASGSLNPLKYRTLVDTVQGWFTEHPLYDTAGQPIEVPEWSFPGRGRVQRQLNQAKTLIERGERALQALPLRGKQAALSARLEDRRTEVERALSYVELYGAYAECEAIYRVDNLMAIDARLEGEDRQRFLLDPRVIDWTHYVRDIHLPSVVEHARVKTTPGKSRTEARATRLRRQVLSPQRQMAAFDLENTLIASNVVESYSWLATRRLPVDDRLRFIGRTLKEAPSLLALDRRDRGDFLRFFYRRYEGAPVDQIDADAAELFSALILTKSFPAGIRRVREHKALGHRTVLITGALSFVVAPLRPLFDEIIAAEMAVKPDGTYAGELTDVPPTGETRAQLLADYCAAEGLDRAESIAYADSSSDLPMLEAVGFPVAVNPETRLAALARKRGWLVEHWEKASGGPRPLLPIGPVWRERASAPR
jgi:HAD superfamily hydrolase (TIGR01490 family)